MFTALNYEEQMELNGGDWLGADLVNAIFECGRKLGSAIRNACGW